MLCSWKVYSFEWKLTGGVCVVFSLDVDVDVDMCGYVWIIMCGYVWMCLGILGDV
jgi:hypothetical protein